MTRHFILNDKNFPLKYNYKISISIHNFNFVHNTYLSPIKKLSLASYIYICRKYKDNNNKPNY